MICVHKSEEEVRRDISTKISTFSWRDRLESRFARHIGSELGWNRARDRDDKDSCPCYFLLEEMYKSMEMSHKGNNIDSVSVCECESVRMCIEQICHIAGL